jgi:hypothetical protein
MSEEPKNVILGKASFSGGGTLTMRGFVHYQFAPKWFGDALSEARRPPSLDTKRREIVFAACCAESYLMEWTLGILLKVGPRPEERLLDFFKVNDRRPVTERYDKVTKKLNSDGLIPDRPDFSDPHGKEWARLLEFRNALVHANVSRPVEPSMKVSPQDLDQIVPGWAVRIVIERIKRLHTAAKTDPPTWLIEP